MSIKPEKSANGQSESQLAGAETMARFLGKTAVVTGVSDQGIGGAVAERLCRRGIDRDFVA